MQVESLISTVDSKDLVHVAVSCLQDKKAEDVVALDIASISSIADFFVICSGLNSRHVRSLADEVDKSVKASTGRSPRAIEGLNDTSWVLMDYGDIVVHIFMPETREFYSLERLWSDAAQLAL